MQELKSTLARRPRLTQTILLGYLVFCGCFLFPLRSTRFPLELSKVWLLVLSYGMIAVGLALLWGSGQKLRVYLCSFGLTALGMLCRFLLEFGEASNTYNFTVTNIVCYLVLIPLYLLLCYHLTLRYAKSESSE